MMQEKQNEFAEGQRVFVRAICFVSLLGLGIAFAMIFLQYGIVSTYLGGAQREIYSLLGLGVLIGYFFVTACFGRFIWFLPKSGAGSGESSR